MRFGFFHPDALTGVCRAWRALIDAVRPQFLVFDFAPTGMLATRGLRIPRVLYGNSFSIPPRTEPMPTYRWWNPAPAARLLEAEQRVLAGANAALARLAEPPMRKLAELLEADDAIITTWKEFDQYPSRIDGRYWGQMGEPDQGSPPPWPAVGAKRVFAYLKPRHRDFDKLLDALRSIDASVVVHAPGLSPHGLRTHTAANVAFSLDPVRMADVCAECDLGVCHAGINTVQLLVTSGKPVLLVPGAPRANDDRQSACWTSARGWSWTTRSPPRTIATCSDGCSRNPLSLRPHKPWLPGMSDMIPQPASARIVDRFEEIMATASR